MITIVLLFIQFSPVALNPDSVEAWSHLPTPGPSTEGTQSEQPSQPVSIAAAENEAQTPSTQQVQPNESVAKYPDPNSIPYRTQESILAHVLSLPAKVWRLPWIPLGAAVIWGEQHKAPDKIISFLLNDEKTGGFYPLVGFGGSTGLSGGVTIFHNNLTNQKEKVLLSFLFRSQDNNDVIFSYQDFRLRKF